MILEDYIDELIKRNEFPADYFGLGFKSIVFEKLHKKRMLFSLEIEDYSFFPQVEPYRYESLFSFIMPNTNYRVYVSMVFDFTIDYDNNVDKRINMVNFENVPYQDFIMRYKSLEYYSVLKVKELNDPYWIITLMKKYPYRNNNMIDWSIFYRGQIKDLNKIIKNNNIKPVFAALVWIVVFQKNGKLKIEFVENHWHNPIKYQLDDFLLEIVDREITVEEDDPLSYKTYFIKKLNNQTIEKIKSEIILEKIS